MFPFFLAASCKCSWALTRLLTVVLLSTLHDIQNSVRRLTCDRYAHCQVPGTEVFEAHKRLEKPPTKKPKKRIEEGSMHMQTKT